MILLFFLNISSSLRVLCVRRGHMNTGIDLRVVKSIPLKVLFSQTHQ